MAPSTSTSRYKISSPQPYIPETDPQLRAQNTPYPPTSSHPPPRPDVPSRTPTGPTTSPARPARSRMRDQIPVPSSRPNLAPITTHSARRPSSGNGNLSPISPSVPTPSDTQPTFSDPFAADRSHRSELRAQTSAQQTPQNAGSDKLRNVVGAFMAAGRNKDGPTERPPRRVRNEVSEEVWNVVEGGKFAEIDNVLQKIKRDWPFVLESDFSPSTLALSLLSKSANTQLSSFLKIHDALSSALQASVQAHFQSFAASLPTHANFVGTLGRAQEQIKVSKEMLREAREGFGGKGKTELAGVRARERQVRDMLHLLDTIDDLKQVPDRLEAMIGDKCFLPAALLLVKSSKTIAKPEIASIGAMSELKAYFASQETILTDIMVEELHSHLYLKTFNSESRWKPYTPGQSSLPVIGDVEQDAQSQTPRLSRYLEDLMNKSQDVESVQSEDMHPEADSYRYIEVLLESLGTMGRLGSALDVVSQRVAGEIHALVEATLDEVEERFDQEEPKPLLQSKAATDASLDVMTPPRHSLILRDLAWTLYSKLAAVLEGHRVVYEVSRWISARRDFKDLTKTSEAFNIPVPEVWKPLQHEIRTILQAYLADDSQGSALSQHALMPVNEILRDGRVARDRQKAMFHFAGTDMRAVTLEIKVIDESIQTTLKASVPGLVSSQPGELSTMDENPSGKHRNLIPANPFNVTTLFQPTVAFIDRASFIAPLGSELEPRAFGIVLEDFVVGVFLPQLDERVTASFQNAVSGYDAYQIDRRIIDADRPPLKSTVRVMALIHTLCTMLETTPFHRENYSRLIVGVIVQYYQQCSTRFKELVSHGSGDANIAMPAIWAQREDVVSCLTDLRAVTHSDLQELHLAGQREIKLETELLKGTAVIESLLINSSRKVEALCHLSQSLRWFIDALLDIQDVAEEDGSHSKPTKGRLPLTAAMGQRFEAIIQTYEQLTEMVLNTLHMEIRCRVMCNLAASSAKGDFRLESEALEPDPDILDLTGRLTEFDSLAQASTSNLDHQFIFRGLSQLVDHMFIHTARSVKVVNAAGVNKIKRNILSLQQSLRSVQGAEEGILERSIQYWDLYSHGPKEMLESLRTSRPLFAFDDYNTMLNLQCKTDQGEAPSAELNTYLIDLHALSMSIEGWEF